MTEILKIHFVQGENTASIGDFQNQEVPDFVSKSEQFQSPKFF